MSREYDLLGKKYGKLTVISKEPDKKYPSGVGYSVWKCLCDCGNYKITSGQNLKRIEGDCGCERANKTMRKFKESDYYKELDLTGKTFDKLTIIKREENDKKHNTVWLCQCECGTQKKITGNYLRKKINTIKSCGCSRIYGPPPKDYGQVAFKSVMTGYKIGAKKRGLPFLLTEYQFKHLTSSDCNYCGLSPRTICKKGMNGQYIYNGIDRVDSQLGYSIDNCVPCCKKCNWSKSNDTSEEFFTWVNRLITFQQKDKK